MARKNGIADQDYDVLYGGGTPARFSACIGGGGSGHSNQSLDFIALEQGFVDLGSVLQYPPNWAQN
jgi:hypothetical protein